MKYQIRTAQSLNPLLPKMILILAPNGFVMLKIFSRPIQYSNGFGVPYNIRDRKKSFRIFFKIMPPTVLHTLGPHESIAPNSDSKFEREHAFRRVFRFSSPWDYIFLTHFLTMVMISTLPFVLRLMQTI